MSANEPRSGRLSAKFDVGVNGAGLGVNGAAVINAALKKLADDAYLCLEVAPGAEANEIKKAYRKIALKEYERHDDAVGSPKKASAAPTARAA